MKALTILSFCLPLFLAGCITKNIEQTQHSVYNSNGIKVLPKTDTDSYPKARLSLVTPNEDIKEGNNNFNFEVSSYNLKDQSASAKTNELANSNKGQHIHFIVDNKPYQAKY